MSTHAEALKRAGQEIRRVAPDVVAYHYPKVSELLPTLLAMDQIEQHYKQWKNGRLSSDAACMAIAQVLCVTERFSEAVEL